MSRKSRAVFDNSDFARFTDESGKSSGDMDEYLHNLFSGDEHVLESDIGELAPNG